MDVKYHFTHLNGKCFNVFSSKTSLDYFLKWSIKGQLTLTTFGFNEAFQSCQKKDLIRDFFNDPSVTHALSKLVPNWSFDKEMINEIDLETIPCTVSSMSFFDRILDEDNKIVRGEGSIRHCLDDVIDGFTVSDELRKMLLDEESDNYGLFIEKDRSEFIFKLFQFLVLGGKWCQFEDKINPYLDITKMLYKDLVRVEKNPETKKIQIRSICIKAIVMGKEKKSIFPVDAFHVQNFAYLIIDPLLRQITVFAHEYGGQF